MWEFNYNPVRNEQGEITHTRITVRNYDTIHRRVYQEIDVTIDGESLWDYDENETQISFFDTCTTITFDDLDNTVEARTVKILEADENGNPVRESQCHQSILELPQDFIGDIILHFGMNGAIQQRWRTAYNENARPAPIRAPAPAGMAEIVVTPEAELGPNGLPLQLPQLERENRGEDNLPIIGPNNAFPAVGANAPPVPVANNDGNNYNSRTVDPSSETNDEGGSVHGNRRRSRTSRSNSSFRQHGGRDNRSRGGRTSRRVVGRKRRATRRKFSRR